MTTPRLIVHVGDYKTGSTSIQHCLNTGGFEAPGCKVFYPKGGPHHMSLVKAMRSRRRETSKDLLKNMADKIRSADADVAVLSAEHFQTLRPVRLLNWVETHLPECRDGLQVIGYVRPHAEFALSLYAEMVKLGARTVPFEDFLPILFQRERLRFRRRWRRWLSVFEGQLILRPVVRDSLHDGDVVADFLNVALAGADVSITASRAPRNTALGAKDLAFMRMMHRQIAKRPNLREDRKKIGNSVYAELQKRPNPSDAPLRLRPEEFAAIREAALEDAKRMDGRFFHGRPLTGALENPRVPIGERLEPWLTLPSPRQIAAVWEARSV